MGQVPMHGISEQQWIDYLDQRLLGGDEHACIDAHLADCHECRELHRRMSRTVKSLQEMGFEVGRRFPVDEDQLHVSLAKVLARILDTEARQQRLTHTGIQERLDQLEEMLALMCGSWTAVNALRVAAKNTLVNSLDELTTDNWTSFLKRLTAIAEVFCGDTGAKLVWEYGKL